MDATSAAHAVQLLTYRNSSGPAMAKADGIDLLDLMKEGIIAPARLVNLKSIPGLDQISIRSSGELEMAHTLAHITGDPRIRKQYPALSEAAGQAATPQVRNTAIIGAICSKSLAAGISATRTSIATT